MPEQQAEVQAEALVGLIEDRLATKKELFEVEAALKRDIKGLETSLKREIRESETSLKRDMKELETSLKRDIEEVRRDVKEMEMRLMIRLGAMFVAGIGVVATLVKIL